jgi:lycopene beta-cyclase
MLASEQFYTAAVAAVNEAPKLHLQLNSALLSEPQFLGGQWHVETTVGRLSAAMVVDTRPWLPSAVDSLLWQSFYGHEIECERPVFDPSCVELMDFSGPSAARVAFSYVLPMSRTRALVEFTVFAAQPLAASALAADLDAAIAQRVNGAAFTLRRSEHGVLPMGLAQPQMAAAPEQAASYVRAGLFAGAARPATGYAFQRIQRWAADCAAHLVDGGTPVGHPPDPRLLAWMDHLFLNVIQRQPEGAPQLFAAMVARVKSQRLIRC